MHTSEGRGRKPATVKDIIMATGGECEIPGELPTSCPITSSPAMPILHMNSHSIWGALLRLVNRPLHHKKGHPQATQSLPAAFCSLPVLNGSHHFLQSLFSYYVLLRYACLIRMSSYPIWGALSSLALGYQASSPLRKGTPKQLKACPLHSVLYPALRVIT